MYDLLIKNGKIITMDQSRRVIEGTVAVNDNEIVNIGNVEGAGAKREIDAEGKIVMPGLVSTYSHPLKILLRANPTQIEPPTELTQFLQRVLWPFEEELTKRDTYYGARAACLEFVKNGITFFAGIQSSQSSISKSLDQVAKAVNEVGLRANIAFQASERNTRAGGVRGMEENIRFLDRIGKKESKTSRVGGMVGLDASFLESDELLRHGKRVASRFGVPLVVPAGEGLVDLYHNLERYGKRPIERFRDLGILSSNTVLAHCVNIKLEELSIIKKSGSMIAHNPLGNLGNAVGVAPVNDMREMDIPVGLGNDGLFFDSFENMRILTGTQRMKSEDLRIMSATECLEMATIEGARLYGLENIIGSLEPGKKADIIIIDSSNSPVPVARQNLASYVVNSVSYNDVETVIVGGDILMNNRNIKTVDEESTMKKSREIASKMWRKLRI